MDSISKNTLEDLKQFLDRGCEYAGTQDVVHATFVESVEELGGCGDWDEMSTKDNNDNNIALQDLFETFYDKIIEKIINVFAT